ncbi:MAG: hypothetical protein WC655_16655, partial [Candidatus Hydrogenedentales bacterium]
MKKDSPAIHFLRHVWESVGDKQGDSWNRLNQAMGDALGMAIKYGMRFYVDDFSLIANAPSERGFNGGYWLGQTPATGERYYTLACAVDRAYGVNMSACLAFEAWKGRPPFICKDAQCVTGRRVAIGSDVEWGRVTSFASDGQSFIACAYDWSNEVRKVISR